MSCNDFAVFPPAGGNTAFSLPTEEAEIKCAYLDRHYRLPAGLLSIAAFTLGAPTGKGAGNPLAAPLEVLEQLASVEVWLGAMVQLTCTTAPKQCTFSEQAGVRVMAKETNVPATASRFSREVTMPRSLSGVSRQEKQRLFCLSDCELRTC